MSTGTGYFVEKQIPDAKTFINVSCASTYRPQQSLQPTSILRVQSAHSSIFGCHSVPQSKLSMLTDNIDKVGMALSGKRRDLEAVTLVLQQKMQAVKQAQEREMAKITA